MEPQKDAQAQRIRELECELQIARINAQAQQTKQAQQHIKIDAMPTTGQAVGAGFGAAFGATMGRQVAGCLTPIVILVVIFLLCALASHK